MLRVAGLRAWRRPVTCMSSGCETTYHTLARATTITEIEVKKSRFLAKASPVSTADEAMAFVRGQSDPGASHNYFAYSIGQGDPSEFRSSDDGEPSGTGGRPILAAIGQENLTNVCVLVTRYYGGTKLGTGGLVSAPDPPPSPSILLPSSQMTDALGPLPLFITTSRSERTAARRGPVFSRGSGWRCARGPE